MGSVSHLYTTGDNDPEIEPQQYYRHYMYCDACGSFDLNHWDSVDSSAPASESTRKRLATAALYVSRFETGKYVGPPPAEQGGWETQA
jgi:hypothetical protein